MDDVAPGQRLGGPHRHLAAEVGQVEVGQPAIEDLGGVVHLAVAEQVDHRAGTGHGLSSSGLTARAAACAAAGSAAAIRSRAPSSCAAETNQAS